MFSGFGEKIIEKVSDDILDSIEDYIDQKSIIHDIEEYCEKYISVRSFDFDLTGIQEAIISAVTEGKFLDVYTTIDPDEKVRKLNDIINRAKYKGAVNKDESGELCIYEIINIVHSRYTNKVSIPSKIIASEMSTQIRSYSKKTYRELIKEIKEIKESSIKPDKIAKVNKAYRDEFNKILFLHKDRKKNNSEKVILENLYVMPEYLIMQEDGNYDETTIPLEDTISSFMSNKNEKIMFIEGDAGMGKSSLCYWLNIHASEIFSDYPLITVRLRDLNKEKCANDSLFAGICDYFINDSLETFTDLYPKVLLLLDGLDELCFINAFIDPQKLLNKFEEIINKDIKVIITSRPKYIPHELSFPCTRVCLQHYKEDKRIEWMEKFSNSKKCNQIIDEKIRKFILENQSGICDTPFMLYIIASADADAIELENEWSIFYQTFHENTFETEYNETFRADDRTYRHPINEYKEAVYRMNEEIAYRMYKTGNRELYIKSDDLNEIVTELSQEIKDLQKISVQDIVKSSYALCTYWKINSENGAVEFYHNNIRDFFMCEKIYREVNGIYSRYKKEERLEEDFIFINEAIEKLFELMQYGEPNATVLKYLKNRVRFKKKKTLNNDYPFEEKKIKLFPNIIEKILTNGKYYYNFYDDNPIKKLITLVRSIFELYMYPTKELLEKGERLMLWRDVKKINENGLFADIIKVGNFLEDNLDHIDLSGINLKGVNLRGANLKATDLGNADLCNADLCGADLSHANFLNTNLEGGNLSHTNLNDAYLFGANLSHANLSEATLLAADLHHVQLNEAILVGSNLSQAKLNSAILEGANLNYAQLKDTILVNANLSCAQLNEAVLEGANLRQAKLNNAVLIRANLRQAKLNDAVLEGGILSQAKLNEAILVGANLRQAKLNDAYLVWAELDSANLSEVVLEGANLCHANLNQALLEHADLRNATLPDYFLSHNQENTKVSSK